MAFGFYPQVGDNPVMGNALTLPLTSDDRDRDRRQHTCAILDNSQVKCWGHAFGQLGLGDVVKRGDNPGRWGTTSQQCPQNWSFCPHMPPGPTIPAPSDNGEVKCWGYNGMASWDQGYSLSRRQSR